MKGRGAASQDARTNGTAMAVLESKLVNVPWGLDAGSAVAMLLH